MIIVRPAAGGGFEVLLNRRAQGMSFLGGFYVFPGGNVQREDGSARLLERSVGLSPPEAQRLLGAGLPAQLALGHWIAAVRETFEEVGILFCVDENGKPVDLGDPERARAVAACRRRLVSRATTFADFLQAERLRCALGGIAYFSHWQTPAEFAARFDTRFFLALLPPGQSAAPAAGEVTEILWLAPDDALSSYRAGRLPLIFPTYASLRALADFSSLESLCAEYRLR
ncbi:MAG TPA: hypothetical protein VNL14_08080 [Candidatus Acidoferrales bacterium]|nr:hypothetical protein [Candidatus Acidoferrales bacterium]